MPPLSDVTTNIKPPRPFSIIASNAVPSSFASNLLQTFAPLGDKEIILYNNDFLNGTLVKSFPADASEEERRRYYHHCLRALDWSFSDRITGDSELVVFFAGAIEDMEAHINGATAAGIRDPESMREQIPLDSIPFRYARRFLAKNIQEFPKDDEIRLACQALFLYLLRPRIPLKYPTLEKFLERYPDLRDRNSTEQERLRHTANWMDLAFYTIQPRNNKTFILNMIPRIVEGRNARYITGSGQTKPTADRVDIFRIEGCCEKIKRPPRRKREEILAAAAAAAAVKKSPAGMDFIMSQIGKSDLAGPSDLSKVGIDIHPCMFMGYPLSYLTSNQWMQYSGMSWATPGHVGYTNKNAEAALSAQAAFARCMTGVDKDSLLQGPISGYWSGPMGVNMYGRGVSADPSVASTGCGQTSPSPTSSNTSSLLKVESMASSPSSSSAEFISVANGGSNGSVCDADRPSASVLGKRKMADEPDPNKVGALHLLFAAVSSIEEAKQLSR